LAALFRLKNQSSGTFDFDYHRRHYQYLHQVIRQLFTQLDEGKLVGDRAGSSRSSSNRSTAPDELSMSRITQVVLRAGSDFKVARQQLEEEVKEMLPRFSPELLESGAEQVTRLTRGRG
jgi:hypothetical protein